MHDIKCKNSMVRAEMIELDLFAIIEKLTQNQDILKVRLAQLVKVQAEPCEAFVEMIREQNRLIQDNLRRQKKQADAYDAREKQKGYQQYVREVLNRFDDAKEESDPIRSFLEGNKLCQKKFLEEIKVSDPSGCLSQPLDVR
ncbi:MAG: hypothetical protein HQL11_01265 [Candidatus Omnitrophica bacterium]|nr:hypothetical protein [Candidatus Omnitrophota bacterium]